MSEAFRSFASILTEAAPPASVAVAAGTPSGERGHDGANAVANESSADAAEEEPGVPAARTRREPPTPPPIMPAAVEVPPVRGTGSQIAAVLSTFAAEIVRLRARAAELVENEAESILQLIATRVLVRELELAPADVRALAERVRAEWNAQHGMRFRVSAADIDRLQGLGATLEVDPALQPGDLQVDFADGALDLRLGTRLAAVLDEHRIAV